MAVAEGERGREHKRMASIQPKLIVVAGPSRCGPFFLGLNKESSTIGRGDDSEICLPGKRISRRHCLLFYRNGKWNVQDLGSGNGTYLNGVRITGAEEISDVDMLDVGNFKLQFLMEPIEEKTLPVPEKPKKPKKPKKITSRPTFANTVHQYDTVSKTQTVPVKKPPVPSHKPSGWSARMKRIVTAAVSIVLISGIVIVLVITWRNTRSGGAAVTHDVPGAESSAGEELDESPPVQPDTEDPPPPVENSEALPALTGTMLDSRVGTKIILHIIRTGGSAKPTKVNLPANFRLKIKIDANPRVFQVLRPWQGKVLWSRGQPTLTKGPVGLAIVSTDPFLWGKKRIAEGTVFLRGPEGWKITEPEEN